MDQKKGLIREFKLTSWAVDNKTTVFFLTFIMVVLGITGYMNLPKEAFPEVKIPTVFVSTPYPGNSPENIEKLITRPLEKEINSISEVDKISSNSAQDYSMIIIEFKSNIEVEDALREVKDAIDRSKSELPTDLDQDPLASEMDMGAQPIMNINLYGDYTPEQLKDYAEDLKDEIEKLSEISDVNLKGIEEKEVKVNLDIYKMNALKLSFNDVSQAIEQRNVTMSAGSVKGSGQEIALKVDGEFKTVSEIENIIVKDENEEIVYLRSILASPIVLAPKEKESYARFDGKNVVVLDVIKGSGENLLAASDKITDILVSARKTELLPKNLNYTVTLDMSDQTRAQVDNLENSIISGVILVIGVLLFFLGTRSSLFVGIAIPMSMFLSFMILSFLGITINMMTLFGLIMALGMLVDNGIVVVENVHRLMDEGYSAIDAAKEGVGEIAWPIIASTATTLAAFLPLAMWPGIMGEFMKYLPITLIIVLSSSLFVALVINPALTVVFMKVGDDDTYDLKQVNKWTLITVVVGLVMVIGHFTGVLDFAKWMESETEVYFLPVVGNLLILFGLLIFINAHGLAPISNKFQNSFLPKLEDWYEKTLDFALRKKNPIWIFIGTIVMFIMSIALLNVAQPNVEFFPINEPKYVNVFIEMPLGTKIQETNEVSKDIEAQVIKVLEQTDSVTNLKFKESVNALTVQVGTGTSDPGDPMAAGGNELTPHKARVTVEFKEYVLRQGVNSQAVMNAIRENITKKKYPDAVLTIAKDRAGPPAGKPVNIELIGDDFDILVAESEKMVNLIRNSGIKGYEEIKTDLELGKPEMIIDIDNAKAERLSVSTHDVAFTLRTALYGREVSKYKDGEDDYPIELRIGEKERNDLNTLMNQSVTFRDPTNGKIKQIPINTIAKLKPTSSLGSIKRKELQRVVTIYSNILDGYNATQINDEIKELLSDHKLPHGYEFKFTGEQESQEEEMSFLMRALLIALFLILLIIIAQFDKISAPIIILSSVLLSTIGVFLGLIIFNMDFIIIMTMIGIISLAGIVVNNAIVLIDYTLLLMERAKDKMNIEGRVSKEILVESIVKGGKTRLRPVLLTAITTVLGLLPLAVGLNIDFFGLFKTYDPGFYIGGENVMFWGPMSWTIIFGITFATFLTLIVVPVMFLGIERLKYYIYDHKKS